MTILYPHVVFQINKEMDYWAAKEFLTFDPKDDFSAGMLDLYPDLKKVEDLDDADKINTIISIVDLEYKEVSNLLADKKLQIQTDWDKVEDKFLKSTEKLFKGHTWPVGEYVGFLSIFNCNPRFLNPKTFQVYYKHEEGPVYVCAHEMLHFMFYDYIEHHKELVDPLTENQIWKLSEIFVASTDVADFIVEATKIFQ